MQALDVRRVEDRIVVQLFIENEFGAQEALTLFELDRALVRKPEEIREHFILAVWRIVLHLIYLLRYMLLSPYTCLCHGPQSRASQ
ncbi:MAG: hypothetical protein JNM62_05945 [Flavobacteriales bacterium]|nr:hypothetical protein [Flavobacteriales bacterium]